MSLHQAMLDAEGEFDNVVDIASRYHEWVRQQIEVRRAVFTPYVKGEEVLTLDAIERCREALLGLAHLRALVDPATARQGKVVGALIQKTQPAVHEAFQVAVSHFAEFCTFLPK